MTRADRPYGQFPRDDVVAPVIAPAAPRRRRFRLRRPGPALLLALGSAALALVALSAVSGAPRPLTVGDMEATVGRVLASQTPAPPFAVAAYRNNFHSIVQVRARTDGRSTGSSGTGVILDSNGRILTSLHIVTGATQITVVFSDGTESTVTVAALRPEIDIVVLQAHTLPSMIIPATLGNPGNLQIGDDAIVVGNPVGLTASLSTGSISGLGRSFKASGRSTQLNGLIQFDAAVNPGSSGGPLLDRNGDVVGIVTGLTNPLGVEAFSGIGFAVPIDVAAAAAGSPPY